MLKVSLMKIENVTEMLDEKFRKIENLPDIFNEYIRILKLARRPEREEFLQVSKITSVMILLVGLIGFTVYVLMTALPKVFF